MKSVFKSLLVALLLTSAFNAQATVSLPADGIVKKSEASYQVALYPATGLNVLNVMIEKPGDKALQIQILDSRGNKLATQHLSRKAGSFRLKFNLEQVTDGEYKVEVNDGLSVSTYPFVVSTQAPVVKPRLISLN